ncbi:RepB family plasmid replication initiator protein, partial [Acinetobacter oleivorans]
PLTCKYATRLYDLLIAWREVGKTPIFELPQLRKNLGVEDDEYQRMHHFKNRVLDTAITQSNEHTDIKTTYEQHKQGRTITGFSVRF